jgi:hypothetical protein
MTFSPFLDSVYLVAAGTLSLALVAGALWTRSVAPSGTARPA